MYAKLQKLNQLDKQLFGIGGPMMTSSLRLQYMLVGVYGQTLLLFSEQIRNVLLSSLFHFSLWLHLNLAWQCCENQDYGPNLIDEGTSIHDKVMEKLMFSLLE